MVFFLQIIAKKFSVACPLFDQAMFEHTHEPANETLNFLSDSVTDEAFVDSVTSLSTSVGQAFAQPANSTESEFLLPEQEEGAKELYEIYGPQVCEAKPFALTDRVTLFRIYWFY